MKRGLRPNRAFQVLPSQGHMSRLRHPQRPPRPGGHQPPGAGVPAPLPNENPKSRCFTFALPQTGQRGFRVTFSRMDIWISNGRPQARHM